MRLRHNKKRNTAFVYEALVRELTKCIVKNNPTRRNHVIALMKEHFSPESILSKELALYKPLYNESNMAPEMASRLLAESRVSYDRFDKKEIFNAQTKLINKINKSLGAQVFGNYVPNYKSIASVYSIFNIETSPKDRIMLEQKIVENLTEEEVEKDTEDVVSDELVYRTFINKFNQKYGEGLHEEQSKLLNHYISSMDGNSLELKIFLNEEIGRIKDKLRENLDSGFADNNMVLKQKTEKVLKLAEGFKQTEINDFVVENLLKMQQLIREVDNAATG